MSKEVKSDPRNTFSVRYLPWLLGGSMLVVYLATLNPWVTLLNLGWLAQVAGWSWQPQLTNPLLFLVALPFHLVSAAKLPWLLNAFSAVCAAVTLGLLARCVALLPHDRLETERQRERNDFAFLTGPLSFLPPVFAVVLLGLQLTFWEHATSFTCEMFELMLFAGVSLQLLEYRLDEAPWRLYLAALIYGAGISEDWAFVGYFPVFVTAVVWLRGLDFFNLQFLLRMFLYGFTGLLLLFLLPVLTKLSGHYTIGFWESMRPGVAMHGFIIRSLASSSALRMLGMVSLASLLPLLVISIRWSSNFGDSSRSGSALVNFLFYLGHAGFLSVCVWVMFDPPFSPKQLTLGGAPGLTLYFISALVLGYLSGFFLLVFGKAPQRLRRGAGQPEPVLPQNLMWLCPLIVGGTIGVVTLAILLLTYKNAPIIRRFNDDTLRKYAQLATRNLPPEGAILLGDNDSRYQQPLHNYLVEAWLAHEGLLKKYPVVETYSARDSVYQRLLHERYPAIWPEIFTNQVHMALNEFGLVQLMNQLAKSNTICYLNPSFGYYFETFYQEPHGLLYRMKPLPPATLLPPPLTPALIQENEQIWSEVVTTLAQGIQAAVTPPDPDRPKNLADRLLARLHISPEPNPNSVFIGNFCSIGLDTWGVQLQQAGALDRAATNFLAAQNFNPDNQSASLNLEFNRNLQDGKIPPLDLSTVESDQISQAHHWLTLVVLNGPIDQLNYAYEGALALSEQNKLPRQSIAVLTRVKQLAPDRFEVRRRLAGDYLLGHLPDRAMEVLNDPLKDPARFALTETDRSDLNTLLAAIYFQKKENARGIALLEKEVELHPQNLGLLAATIQSCMTMGFYTNALALIDRQLKQTPDDPKYLFMQGMANLQSGQYNPAIDSLTRVLDLSSNAPTPLFNRALAYLGAGRLKDARADYLRLQNNYTNSFQIAFGLGEIAWRQHDTNEAIRNYEIYLASTKTNTAEAALVTRRLQELKK